MILNLHWRRLSESMRALLTCKEMLSPILTEAEIVDFTVKNRLPSMYGGGGSVEIGGLMSYGPNPDDLYRRAATYLDKILKGAKPADLPSSNRRSFEFVINRKT